MKLNSNYSELELCEYMINNMDDDDLKELILDNPSLRIKYGAFDKKNFKYEREKAINIAISLFKSNKSLRESVIDVWKIESMLIYRKDSNIESIEDAKKYIKEDSNADDMLLLAIALWGKSSSELNEYGDEIFNNCLSNKYKRKEEIEMSTMNDTSKILSMNLAECIDAISNYDAKIKEYEEKLKAKDEVIKELREQLKQNGDSKELKKEITKLEKTIEKSSNDFKNNSDNTTKVVDTLKIDLTDIKKEVNKQSTAIDSNNKVLVNELTKIIKDLQNAITSSILDDNRKLVKGINESISKQLDTIIENTTKEDVSVVEVKEEKTKPQLYAKYTDNGITGVQEFSSELDDLLDGAI